MYKVKLGPTAPDWEVYYFAYESRLLIVIAYLFNSPEPPFYQKHNCQSAINLNC